MRLARRDTTLPTVAVVLLIGGVLVALLWNQPASPTTLSSAAQQQNADADLRAIHTTDEQIWTLQARIRRNPDDVDAHALLGAAYVQRARETGDPSYYAKADQVLGIATTRDPQHVEALIGKGTLALARHEFATALQLGQQAQALNPSIARIYGVIADAQIELGMYNEAVTTVQTMVDLRPDLGSYSRASYVRELHGDLPGAIEAMTAAVRAGGPTSENTQWVRVQLALLFFNTGDLATAEQHIQRSLAEAPEYVPAMAALARIRAAQGRYAEAIKLGTQATQRMPLPEYVIALGDTYAKTGDQAAAQQQYKLVQAIDQLMTTNGVNTDLETALFFADHDLDLPTSLAKARAAYTARPSIHAADGLAWTLYKSGQYAEAQRYANEALKLGSRDALKLFHAGMIANALGQRNQARKLLQQALDLNPHFSLLYADQASATLRELERAN